MSYRKLLFAILFLLAIDSYASVVTVSTHVHDMEFRVYQEPFLVNRWRLRRGSVLRRRASPPR